MKPCRRAELVFSVSVALFFAGCGCVIVGLGGFVIERAHGVAVDPALSNYEALHTLGGACICIGACFVGRRLCGEGASGSSRRRSGPIVTFGP